MGTRWDRATAAIGSDCGVRRATAADASAVAGLHADSWRRHYRFAYPPEFFGESLYEGRQRIWTARLSAPSETYTAVAEIGLQLVGFVHAVCDEDATWGSLIDNLHVRHDMQRSGIGADLLKAAAVGVRDAARSAGVYLWVLEGNEAGRSFYARLQAREVESVPAASPALSGINKIRCAWSTLTELEVAAET